MKELELNNFYLTFQQEISSLQMDSLNNEENENIGGSKEELFTRFALELLESAGETENSDYAYDEKALGTRNQHKINGYAISENYENLDLFITLYKGEENITRIAKTEIDTAAIRVSNFFKKAYEKNYANEIEHSSRIFDLAHTIALSDDLRINLIRVNALILTDCTYDGEIPREMKIEDVNIYFRVIDLKYLMEIDEKSHLPIEINFKEDGFEIPCIASPSTNNSYESYLAVMPGNALASIYEKYGSRLLEQNVRSFLQFTGKINKGIRSTLKEEPHMFLAFNNGISATAGKIFLGRDKSSPNYFLEKVTDFQIVNGGQTTASIYHSWKKEHIKIENVFVPLKLTVINHQDSFAEIVSRIAEYANTQNKVSVADLSSNRPFHIQLEKLSRSILTPYIAGINRSKWFYERARGQYRNARLKEGTTSKRRKEFDLMYPKKQVITKEELAKFVNAYKEKYKGKKLIIGPHLVVRGNQKNYIAFLGSNIPETSKIDEIVEEINNIYFEESIAKAILFRSAEKLYGVKPNAIGDMRYITVPYAISLLNYIGDDKLDLYKIWENQKISDDLSEKLHVLMRLVENHIRQGAPGSLYGEWAKKLECWESLKEYGRSELTFITLAEDDKISSKKRSRKLMTSDEVDAAYFAEIASSIKAIEPSKWKEIYLICKENPEISEEQKDAVRNLGKKLSHNIRPESREILIANMVLDKIKYGINISVQGDN